MQIVARPAVDAPRLYDEVSRRRHPSTTEMLQGARGQVCDAYKTYEQSAEPATLTPIGATGSLRKALRGNYERFKETHADLYGSLKLASRWCPYCGDRDVTGLDHYLPDAVFPEFSILPDNLIPACSDCNRIKSTSFVDHAGAPRFLHAYLDDLSSTECLAASVDTASGVALMNFTVECPAHVEAELAAKVKAHFDALSLARLYKDRAEQEAAIRAYDVEELDNRGLGVEEISEYLTRSADGARQVHGTNHWRPVALEALAQDAAFCSGACAPTAI